MEHRHHCCDGATRRDPTGTTRIVKGFQIEARRHFGQIRKAAREGTLLPHDIALVLTGKAWWAPALRNAVAKGLKDGQQQLAHIGRAAAPVPARDFDAQARAAFGKIATDLTAAIATQDRKTVMDAINQFSRNAEAAASFLTVLAYNETLLDTFKAAGVKNVGIIPETIPATKVGDAKAKKPKPKPKKPAKKTRRRRPPPPPFEGLAAEFTTQGDDKVCPECELLAGEEYTVDEARGVIPVHPNCRCTWEVTIELPDEEDDDGEGE